MYTHIHTPTHKQTSRYLMLTLGSCVALQSRVAVVPLITRWSIGGTEMTVRPAKYPKEENNQMIIIPLCQSTIPVTNPELMRLDSSG